MSDCEILIIDDDIDDVEMLTRALGESGLDKVHFFHSVEEAFKYLEVLVPDCIPKLIVIDFFLPPITAVEFMNKFRDMVMVSHVKVLVWTSSKSALQADNLNGKGIYDYHLKPGSMAEFKTLAEKMRDLVRA